MKQIFKPVPTGLEILAGPRGLKAGQELTFFYPSTEWDMAQGFDCFCGSEKCLGYISGAKNLSRNDLKGHWLSGHIRELLAEEREIEMNGNEVNGVNGKKENGNGVEVANGWRGMQKERYLNWNGYTNGNGEVKINGKGAVRENGVGSRELGGEMGGDTL